MQNMKVYKFLDVMVQCYFVPTSTSEVMLGQSVTYQSKSLQNLAHPIYNVVRIFEL